MRIIKFLPPVNIRAKEKTLKYNDCSEFDFIIHTLADKNRFIKTKYEGNLKEVLLYFLNLKNRTSEENRRLNELREIVIKEHNHKFTLKEKRGE
jgi:hypothetical protein